MTNAEWDRIITLSLYLFFVAFAVILILYYESQARVCILESEVKRKVSANRVGRTVAKNYVTFKYVNDDNDIKEETVTIWGNLTDKNTERKVKRVTGYDSVLVTGIVTKRFYASMPIETFVENATIIESQDQEG